MRVAELELKERTLDGTATVFTYDQERHLIGAEGANGGLGDETFEVDANGNRIAHSRVAGALEYDANDRLLKRGQTTYEYDANGNLSKRSEPGRTLVFRYDGFNRLVEVQDGGGATVARYGYDPFDRRLWKEAGADENGLDLFLEELDISESKAYVKRILVLSDSYRQLYPAYADGDGGRRSG